MPSAIEQWVINDKVTDEIAGILSDGETFHNLNPAIIHKIANYAQIEHFKIDQILVRHGKTGKRLYFILKGVVEVQIPDVHGEIRKRVLLKKGDVVGEISLLTESTYSANIVALSDTTTFYLDSQHFISLIREYPEFAEIMSTLMTNRMTQNRGINQVGRYQLLGKLGEGTMATVFRAYDKKLDREVALKMLKYNLACNPRFVDRFEQEAKIIASLNHPNIVNVIEVIEEFSTHFIVMEKLQGQNLSMAMKQKGAFSIQEVREILSQLASALQYAHSHGETGIIHRDIKPSNIVIDHDGNIKLTDFGIASPPQDKDIRVEGTPSYMAPEIINSELSDGRADIYSLGVMAFHMLTGSRPFSASRVVRLLKMQVEQPPPDIRNARPDIDEELAFLIEQSLSKDPNRRISDWNRIREILRPVESENKIQLEPDELGILIRFRDTSYKKSAKLTKAIQKLLEDENTNHTIKLHKGSNTD